MGMYGPNDALGAMGYDRSNKGCCVAIIAFIAIGAGLGLFIAL